MLPKGTTKGPTETSTMYNVGCLVWSQYLKSCVMILNVDIQV